MTTKWAARGRSRAWSGEVPVASAVDAGLALVVGLAVALLPLGVPQVQVGLLLVASAALAWRRTYPSVSAVVVLVAVAAAWAAVLVGELTDPVLALGGALLLVSTYSATAWGSRRLVPLALLAALGSAAVAGVLLGGLALTSVLLGALTAAGLAWTVGQWRRTQRRYLAEVTERARRAEAEAEAAARRAADEERARIARELHDVIAHSLAVMTAQADGARFVLSTDPERATTALRAIADTGRAASRDMGGLLGVLGDPGASGGPGAAGAPLRPQPRLAELTDLVADVVAAGLSVNLRCEGEAVPVSPGVEMAVHRAVQEALTNVLKHAGPGARAEVVLAWTPQRLAVRVDDDGPGAASGPTTPGRGLSGMVERVAQVGGSVSASPRPAGGFRVDIAVPLRTATP